MPSRDQVRQEVVDSFTGPISLRLGASDKHLSWFPSLERAYYAKILAFKKDRQVDLYSRVILPCLEHHVPKVMSNHWLGNAGRALEDILMKDDYGYGIRPSRPWKTPEGIYLEPEIREFIRAS